MGFPPTSTKGSGDATPVTTFEIDFPNNPITHTGIIASIGATTIAGGGTGQTTKATAFDALSPMSASGDIVYGGASGTGTRLAKGSDGQVLALASGLPSWVASPAGRILQIVQGTKTDTNQSTSISFVDTGVTATITPSSTSSKILVMAVITITNSTAVDACYLTLVRGSTEIFLGDTSSSRARATAFVLPQYNYNELPVPINYLDSPATTSATTYKVQARVKSAALSWYLNRNYSDPDNVDGARTASSIILMEYL